MRLLGEIIDFGASRGRVRTRIIKPTKEEWEHAFLSRTIAGKNCCIIWTGYRNGDGYGQSVNPNTKKREVAHRISFELFSGKPAGELKVCHTCDNPPCINPNHLFLGTQKDNMLDASNKGKFKERVGQNHPRSTLTTEQVLEIRRLHTDGIKIMEIVSRFSSTIDTICSIVHRRTWKHI